MSGERGVVAVLGGSLGGDADAALARGPHSEGHDEEAERELHPELIEGVGIDREPDAADDHQQRSRGEHDRTNTPQATYELDLARTLA